MKSLEKIIDKYNSSFANKKFNNSSFKLDVLAQLFGLNSNKITKNKQYWNRELGACWELLIIELVKEKCKSYKRKEKIGRDEPIDLLIGRDAIDTKYRVGSGDSGTLKKFKQYGNMIKNMGLAPIMLILREDNLPSAITAMKAGGWDVKVGEESFKYILQKTGFDLYSYLKSKL